MPRALFRCPPGLPVPHRVTFELEERKSIEVRTAKRDRTVAGFKRETAYQITLKLRQQKHEFQTPEEEEPQTPSTMPHISKRNFERDFRAFKAACERWSTFLREGKAKSKKKFDMFLTVEED